MIAPPDKGSNSYSENESDFATRKRVSHCERLLVMSVVNAMTLRVPEFEFEVIPEGLSGKRISGQAFRCAISVKPISSEVFSEVKRERIGLHFLRKDRIELRYWKVSGRRWRTQLGKGLVRFQYRKADPPKMQS